MKRLSFCLALSLLMIGTLVSCGGNSSSTAPLTAAQIVAADKAALAVNYASGDTSSSVTQNLTLTTSSSQGSVITWNSSSAAVISDTGANIRTFESGGQGMRARIEVALDVNDRKQLERILNGVKRIPGVFDIERVYNV